MKQSILDQLKPLRARNEISQQQMFEAEQTLAQADLQQQPAEANVIAMMLPPRAEALAEGAAKIAAANEAIATSQARLDLHVIRSPIAGAVDWLTCHPGQTLAAGSEVGQVIDSRHVYAEVWLPVHDASRVQTGQTAAVSSDGFATAANQLSTNNSKSIDGAVVFVGQVIDPQTGNLPVRVELENVESRFAMGQLVYVSIRVTEPKLLLAVPLDAIHDEGSGPRLTVIRDGKAVALEPQLGLRQHDWISVFGTDLREGEAVIVEGAYNLPDGTPVVATAGEGSSTSGANE